MNAHAVSHIEPARLLSFQNELASRPGAPKPAASNSGRRAPRSQHANGRPPRSARPSIPPQLLAIAAFLNGADSCLNELRDGAMVTAWQDAEAILQQQVSDGLLCHCDDEPAVYHVSDRLIAPKGETKNAFNDIDVIAAVRQGFYVGLALGYRMLAAKGGARF